MNYKTLLIVFLVLLMPIIGCANANLSSVFTNFTNPVTNTSESTNNSITDNENVLSENTRTTAQISDTDGTDVDAGSLMIQKGLEATAISSINDIFVSFGGVQLGSLNNTSGKDLSQIAIFAVAAHTIDLDKDPGTSEDIKNMRNIYIDAILIFAAILAIFLIYQSLDPENSAKLLNDVTGSYNYVSPYDMATYYVKTCGWLILGPLIFFASLKFNNMLVEGQMLSVLDQVAFTSDHIGLYLIMCVLWLFSTGFFAVRLCLIIIGSKVWIFNGIGLAFKKIRWVAIIIIGYVVVSIFSQFFIIWVCCVMVSYVSTQLLSWYSAAFIYLGMFLMVVLLEIMFAFWPIIWKLASPSSATNIIRLLKVI